MLNQSFTGENFRKIFDYENRKGNYLEGDFFPDVAEATNKIRICNKELIALRRNRRFLSKDVFKKRLTELIITKKQLKGFKESLLSQRLERVGQEVTNNGISSKMIKIILNDKKPVYSIKRTPTAFFAIKQIQHNIKRLYKVKQSNRHEIVCQLLSVLGDSFPKYIIRTDIESFYESIPRDRLLNSINKEELLTSSSKKIIRLLLKDYELLSLNKNGIPRGIGVSAYLAEIYMRDFDNSIKAKPEVIYYARYVDDIIVIFAPSLVGLSKNFMSFMSEKANLMGLTLNDSKTTEHNLLQPKDDNLEYLGYKIHFGNGDIKINLSENKIRKYQTRMRRSFAAYVCKRQFNERKARSLLIKRIKFLTSNTRLINNKSNILTGIYFTNSLLSNSDDLLALDKYLTILIDSLKSEIIEKRLRNFTFYKGFNEQRYVSFKSNELAKIVKVWKYGT